MTELQLHYGNYVYVNGTTAAPNVVLTAGTLRRSWHWSGFEHWHSSSWLRLEPGGGVTVITRSRI